MAKTTKRMSAKTGESGAELANIKSASRKVAAKNASTESLQASKTATKKRTVTKKSIASKTVAGKAAVPRQISSAERRGMIAEAAYLRSEAQGFHSDEQEDWLLAEVEVDNLLIRADVIVSD